MKKLFFLSLVLTGLGSTASAQLQPRKALKKQPVKAANTKTAEEKLQIEKQNESPKKASKKVVLVTPKAETIVNENK